MITLYLRIWFDEPISKSPELVLPPLWWKNKTKVLDTVEELPDMFSDTSDDDYFTSLQCKDYDILDKIDI